MDTLKLNELVALVHYKRDFKHVNPIFNTLNLRVDEIEGKLVISDLSRNKVATIKSKKDSGSTILTGNGFYSVTNDFKLEASFEHNKNIITYEAKIDGHGRHQKTRIKVKKDNKVFSVSISNPNFSEFGMKIKTEGSIHIWDSVYMSKDNLNIAKSTNQLYTFMNIRYPKAYLPKYDWVIPFQISINNKLNKDYNDVYFQFHTDIKEEYKIIKSVKFNGTTINQNSIIKSKLIFDYVSRQAIASDIALNFLNEVFSDFEPVFKGILTVARNIIQDFDDIFVIMNGNPSSRNETINKHISTFDQAQVPLFESKNLNLPLTLLKKVQILEKINNRY